MVSLNNKTVQFYESWKPPGGGPVDPPEGTVNPEDMLVNDLSEIDADIWGSISSWGKETGSLQSFQNGIAYSLMKCKRSKKNMSYKQAKQGIKILNTAYESGFIKEDNIKLLIEKYSNELE